MIYLDNGATSFPKAPGAGAAMAHYMEEVGASVNRGTYAPAQEAAMTCLSLREKVCRLLGGEDPTHCILTPGATWGLNLALRGYLRPGDRCLVSAVEHNAVLRPLHDLAEQGVEVERIPCDPTGRLSLEAMADLLRKKTRLVVLCHGSNVSGTIQDGEAAAVLCRAAGVPLVLDAAQTAGHWPIDFAGWGLAGLSAPGHKGLLGPSGIGVLLLSRDFARDLTSVITGGTGSDSHKEEQPSYLPDKFEPGTSNLPGIYGLEAAVSWVLERGVDAIRRREEEMIRLFLDAIRPIPNIRLAGSWEAENRAAVFSIDFVGKDNGEIAYRLEEEYGILTRSGLHCAASAHKTLGTYPQGTVRFTPGPFTTNEELLQAAQAIAALAGE